MVIHVLYMYIRFGAAHAHISSADAWRKRTRYYENGIVFYQKVTSCGVGKYRASKRPSPVPANREV